MELAEKRGKAPTSGLAFGRHFSDHMFVAEFDTAHGGWHKARIEPLRALHLHPASKALHTSISVFEGMKAFRGVDGRIRLFRPHVNAKRLNDSADRAVLPVRIVLIVKDLAYLRELLLNFLRQFP